MFNINVYYFVMGIQIEDYVNNLNMTSLSTDFHWFSVVFFFFIDDQIYENGSFELLSGYSQFRYGRTYEIQEDTDGNVHDIQCKDKS